MSADVNEKLLQLVDAARGSVEDNCVPDMRHHCAAQADALLGELSREYAAMAARIAELGSRVEALEVALSKAGDNLCYATTMLEEAEFPVAAEWTRLYRDNAYRAARRALTPGGE